MIGSRGWRIRNRMVVRLALQSTAWGFSAAATRRPIMVESASRTSWFTMYVSAMARGRPAW